MLVNTPHTHSKSDLDSPLHREIFLLCNAMQCPSNVNVIWMWRKENNKYCVINVSVAMTSVRGNNWLTSYLLRHVFHKSTLSFVQHLARSCESLNPGSFEFSTVVSISKVCMSSVKFSSFPPSSSSWACKVKFHRANTEQKCCWTLWSELGLAYYLCLYCPLGGPWNVNATSRLPPANQELQAAK